MLSNSISRADPPYTQNVVNSLARDKKKNVESIASRLRDTVSRVLSASVIRDGVKHGQMRFIHNPPLLQANVAFKEI